MTLPTWNTTGHHKYISYLEAPETTEKNLTAIKWFIKKFKLKEFKKEIFSISRWVKNIPKKQEDKQDSGNEERRLNRNNGWRSVI